MQKGRHPQQTLLSIYPSSSSSGQLVAYEPGMELGQQLAASLELASELAAGNSLGLEEPGEYPDPDPSSPSLESLERWKARRHIIRYIRHSHGHHSIR